MAFLPFVPWRASALGLACALGSACALGLAAPAMAQDPGGGAPEAAPQEIAVAPPAAEAAADDQTPERRYVRHLTELGNAVLAFRLGANGAGTAVVSPVSLGMALAILAQGSAGATEASFIEGLMRSGTVADLAAAAASTGKLAGDQVALASAVWTSRTLPVRPAFTERIDALAAPPQVVDFADANTIAQLNEWVGKATRGKIREVGLMPTALTDLLLVSVLHFKGAWAERFDPAMTRDAAFTLDGGAQVQVPMMHRAAKVAATRQEGWTAIRLPFQAPAAGVPAALAAVLVLPPAGNAALPDWARLHAGLDAAASSPADIRIPRLSVTDTINLIDALAKTPLAPVVSQSADYSVLSEAGGVVTDGIQKSLLTLDEEGAEAAAVTSMAMTRSAEGESLAFVADRPFHLGIFDQRSGAPLFLARIGDPRG